MVRTVLIFCLAFGLGTFFTFTILLFSPLESYLHPPYCMLMDGEHHGIDMPYPPVED